MSRAAQQGRLLGLMTLLCCLQWAMSSCTLTPSLPVNRLGDQAILYNHQGITDYEAGDYSAAVTAYQAALRISRTIEAVDQIAINLLGLSVCYYRQRDYEQARGLLNEIRQNQTYPFALSDKAEAAFFLALIALAADDLTAAIRWAEQASNECGQVACLSHGKMLNLQVRLGLKEAAVIGDLLKQAQQALTVNKEKKNWLEMANSHRLLGRAQRLAGAPQQAEQAFLAALALDKQLGLPKKIYGDLQWLGVLSCQRGEQAKGLRYLDRAQAVVRHLVGEEQEGKLMANQQAITACQAGHEMKKISW